VEVSISLVVGSAYRPLPEVELVVDHLLDIHALISIFLLSFFSQSPHRMVLVLQILQMVQALRTVEVA